MRFGALGPRATKLFARNMLIFLAGLFGLTIISFRSDLELGNIGTGIALIIFGLGALAFLGLFNIGPLKEGIAEAIQKDREEENQKLEANQPWE